ncbi:hypothetical protein M011DRAFT_471024 [Sporormia fimetaria CBS 119925]|uniref:Uncharacterized protein n=1 Tax=Sporormia fimetaria CBS 119925 TaxID=1340428 RepID=A0A6A6V050_9PLEO|nr:hypothetical protein M011DRAFT_471024 [Sporormia fimetaria CBS 119925]
MPTFAGRNDGGRCPGPTVVTGEKVKSYHTALCTANMPHNLPLCLSPPSSSSPSPPPSPRRCPQDPLWSAQIVTANLTPHA